MPNNRLIRILSAFALVLTLFISPTPATGADALMNGEIPLMEGARVIKETIEGGSGRFVLEVSAPVADVVNYYNRAMTAKGWPSGSIHTIGNRGAIMLHDGTRQFALKAEFKNGVTKVILSLINR